jgi:hypothetical protein
MPRLLNVNFIMLSNRLKRYNQEELSMTKGAEFQKGKSDVYNSRENWPPYTYKDYPDIQPKTYKAFMEFLNTENTSGRLIPGVLFAIFQPPPQAKSR